MIYSCKPCTFETDKKTNYTRHIESTKHKHKIAGTKDCDKEKRKFVCEFCDSSYLHHSSLCNHRKLCNKNPDHIDVLKQTILEQEKIIIEKERENTKLQIEKSKEIIAEKDKLINHMKEENDKKDKEIEFHKNLTMKAGEIAGTLAIKSVNALTYAVENFKNAPQLTPLKDYSVIRDDQGDCFEEKILYKYKTNQLSKYLSIIVIDQYVKKDKKKQATWNTDTTRKHYIVHVKNSENELEWIKDKKGLKCKKKIVTPMLSYIRDSLRIYLSTLNKTTADKVKNYESIGNIALIIGKIDKGTLANEIISEIAPHFYLDMNSPKLLK